MCALRFPISRETETEAQTPGSLERIYLEQAVTASALGEIRHRYQDDTEAIECGRTQAGI